jgi:hypothetical protein
MKQANGIAQRERTQAEIKAQTVYEYELRRKAHALPEQLTGKRPDRPSADEQRRVEASRQGEQAHLRTGHESGVSGVARGEASQFGFS